MKQNPGFILSAYTSQEILLINIGAEKKKVKDDPQALDLHKWTFWSWGICGADENKERSSGLAKLHLSRGTKGRSGAEEPGLAIQTKD